MTAAPVFEGAYPVAGRVVRPHSLGRLHRNDRFPHLYWQNFLSERLCPGFLERGYREAVLVTMVLRRPPDREPLAADLVESALRSSAPPSRPMCEEAPDRMGELCRLKDELGRSGVRFLAALVDGEVAGWCEVRCYEPGGQVEDVVVLEPFRGRGLARALVCGAVERLRRSGCEPIFLVADDKDTVKDLYARLGFDGVRRTWSFWWPGP